jgi:hypothetical protein
MLEDPNDDFNENGDLSEHAADPLQRARYKSDDFRMHAELVAVFEAKRKFDAGLLTDLDPDLARDIQKRIAKLDKAKIADAPIIAPESASDAVELLNLPRASNLSTNDYHIYRRPAELMIVRWLAGREVETFYERLQAHFDAALAQFREDERQANQWKQEPAMLAYLDALDKLEVKMPDRYLREVIRKHRVVVLSTQTVDEMDILYLCDYVIGVEPPDLVGPASAPPEHPTERDRAWFFKLFALRGISEQLERMCFFAYLQKTEDTFEL